MDELTEVRSVAALNLLRFNGTLSVLLIAQQPSSSKKHEELSRLYANVREAYNIRRYCFAETSR